MRASFWHGRVATLVLSCAVAAPVAAHDLVFGGSWDGFSD